MNYVACQSPLFLEFPRQEYWTSLPFPSPGDLSDPGIKPGSPTLQADSLLTEPPGNVHMYVYMYVYMWIGMCRYVYMWRYIYIYI